MSKGSCLSRSVCCILFLFSAIEEEGVAELGCERKSDYRGDLGEDSRDGNSTGGFSGCLYEGAHPLVFFWKPMSKTHTLLSPIIFLFLQHLPFTMRMLRPSTLTCHHACDSRRGITALSTGGDVGWVSRQRGPHHLSPW